MTIVCQYQYKVHAKVTVYLLIIDHYLWCKQSLHYREVVMGRWKFEYAAIQRKMPLSLSNFPTFCLKFPVYKLGKRKMPQFQTLRQFFLI